MDVVDHIGPIVRQIRWQQRPLLRLPRPQRIADLLLAAMEYLRHCSRFDGTFVGVGSVVVVIVAENAIVVAAVAADC